MVAFAKFLGDDAGAVTVDWTVVTGGLLLLGIMVIYTIFNSEGVDNLISNSNETLGGSGPTVTVGPVPTVNGSSGGGSEPAPEPDPEPCVGIC